MPVVAPSLWTSRFVYLPLAGGLLLLAVGQRFDLALEENARSHVMAETSVALIALLVAFLMIGRYRHRGFSRDLLLMSSLTILGGSALLFSALPRVISTEYSGQMASWAPLICHTIGTLLLAVAAFRGTSQRGPARGNAIRWAFFGAAITLTGIAILVAALHDRLPRAVLDAGVPGASTTQLQAHSLVIALQVGLAVALVVAAVGFFGRGRRDEDELMMWFGAGALIAAFARISFSLHPSLYASLFSAGDLLRLISYGCLVIGVSREVTRQWRGLARLAVLEERRRVAGDLHDGLSQELALITGHSRRFMRTPPDREALSFLAEAAERALFESRRAISTLRRESVEPLDLAIAKVAEEAGERAGIAVSLDLDPGPPVDVKVHESLLRIVRDAVNGRGRRALEVSVELRRGDMTRLRIVTKEGPDDATRDPGMDFSMESIRQRARSVGAEVRFDASTEEGDVLEVVTT